MSANPVFRWMTDRIIFGPTRHSMPAEGKLRLTLALPGVGPLEIWVNQVGLATRAKPDLFVLKGMRPRSLAACYLRLSSSVMAHMLRSSRNAELTEPANSVNHRHLIKGKAGSPYLETHPVVWLSGGGQDSIENTVAFCPNCHRRMHVLDSTADVRAIVAAIRQSD